jgi:tetratricopeptide (TPR) repeat protein
MFREGIRAEPESAMIQNNLGCNFLLQKKFFEAEEAFRFAMVSSPDFQRAHMNLGIALVHQGRFDEALAEFKKVVAEDVAHYNVGVVCIQKQDYSKSQAYLREALAINPKCQGAQQQLDRAIRLANNAPPSQPKPRPDVPAGTPLAGTAADESAAP